MKCYLIAVTLTLTVLVQVCHLKSIVHESSSGIKAESYEWDFLKEVKPEHHGRQKRFIGAIFGFAKVIIGATRLGLSVANDKKQNAAIADIQRSLARQGDDITDVQRSLAKQGDDITDIQDTLALHHREMTYVKAKLQDLDGKLDTLSKDVESLAQLTADGQQRLEAGQDRLLDGQQKIQAGQQRLHGGNSVKSDVQIRHLNSLCSPTITP